MYRLLTALFLAFVFFCELSGQVTVCNYKYRKRIAFDPNQVSGSNDLTDFPALIEITADTDLETVANGGHVENANGYDIIFTADNGITLLNHDLNSYNAATGALTVWVKIPVLSTSLDTYIYMYYGNSAIATNQSSPNTWSNGFVGVWHFDNNVNNSTSTAGLDGTNNGSTNTATSKFGTARNFASGSSQYVEVTPYNSAYDIASEITVSGWVRMTSINSDQKFAGNQDGANGGWKFGIFSDNRIEFEIRTSGNSPFLSRSASGGLTLAANTWYYVVGQYSDAGNFIRTYRNGNLDRNYNTAAVAGTSPGTLKFGREPFANTAHFNGIMDELRISNVVRSADWIATEYANQNSPSTFYTIHPEPKVWDGSNSTAWNTNANWVSGGRPVSGEDVIIPDVGNQPVLNTSIDIGGLWIHNNATFNNGTNTQTLSVAYDILNCGIYIGNQGHLRLNTNTIQVQHISGDGTYVFDNLIIDNQFFIDPTTRLNKDVQVSGSLSLLSGIVGTDATNILTLGTNAISTSGSQQSFIHGPMAKQGTAAFVFPVGKGQEWRRLRISGITSNTTFRAEYFNTAFTNSTPVTAPLDNVSVIEYWQLDRTAGTGNANVSLYWENVAYSGIDDCPDLTIARWNGAAWVEHAATEVAGSSCSGAGTGTIITNAVVTNFSPFTFGSTTPGLNALPLTVVNFTSVCEGRNVRLQWEDHSPANSIAYVIERTSDGERFDEIGKINTTDGENKQAVFSHTDALPSGPAYYRIRQESKGGSVFYTPLISASCLAASYLNVYPNPNTGEFTLTGLPAGTDIHVLNALGQVVLREKTTSTAHQIILPGKGLYFLNAEGLGTKSGIKVLVN